LRLIDPSAGSIVLDDADITRLPQRQLIPYRRRMQMIFQDPFSSLNPRQTIGKLLETPLKVHGVPRAERKKRLREIVDKVSLPLTALEKYPHQFSGGQRQRIGIARAVILNPQLIVCDEPVSALDLSIQAQILNLLVELKKSLDLSYLFISHDLSVVRYFADRIMVMYMGRIVEMADHDTLWDSPQHPYTKFLLSAVPLADPNVRAHESEAPVPRSAERGGDLSVGCRYRNRCPIAIARCATEDPALRQIGPKHAAACHLAGANGVLSSASVPLHASAG
jgi:peptide/nickel transport system ATP-binding protein